MISLISSADKCKINKCNSENKIVMELVQKKMKEESKMMMDKLINKEISLSTYKNYLKKSIKDLFSTKEQQELSSCLVEHCNNELKEMFEKTVALLKKSCHKDNNKCNKKIDNLSSLLTDSEIKLKKYKKILKILYTSF